MKTRLSIIPALLVFLALCIQGLAQSSFSPEAYLQFRSQHQNYTAGQLLYDHPARTTYYAQRQYPASLPGIPWFDTLDSHFQFTGDEKGMLSKNCFMVTERINNFSWTDAFIDLYRNDLPLFLSSDFILSTLHNSYDAILQTLEWQYLEPNLKELLLAMYNRFPLVAANYADDSRFDAVLKDVDLYISVARSLAEGKNHLPQWDGPEKFNQVMEGVAAEQMTEIKLFTESRKRRLDFSQFTPRGHYNKVIYTIDGERTLENYFRAMMWLGRIDFLLTAPPENPWEENWTEDELRRMQLGALLANEVLYSCGKLSNLNKHEEIISYMVGPDDNLTPIELNDLSQALLDHPADLFLQDDFDAFMEALNASDDFGQKIMSNFFLVDPDTTDPGKLPVSYKLLGQKFLIDSYVFSEVVFDRIVFEGKKIWRPLPDPLDAMAALGNEDALALLEGEMEQYKYAANMAGLKYLIEAYDDDFWDQSFYNIWLGAIRSLNPPESTSGLPYFMNTTAWHQEKLNTQLTSWAQLRHDNILYGKQSYTGGTGCSYPYTYVEPYPLLYQKLILFAENAEAFFEKVLPEDLSCKAVLISYYREYALLMEKLYEIVQMELNGTILTESQVSFLKTMINDYMASGPSVTGWYRNLFFDPMKGFNQDFTVADVHTQPTDRGGAVIGNVLHVGNGVINMGVFLADNPCNPGELMAFAGPVSSFHTRVTSNFERLTDQEWEETFWAGYENFPERPDWVAGYLLDNKGDTYEEGRELKGAIYTGKIEQKETSQLIDYLLLFPNPVEHDAHVRFVLKREALFSMEVYDIAGRIVHRETIRMLNPAEHDIQIPAESWASGMYLVRINLGDSYFTKELVVQ
jgi:Protein of unknown function (DUF3160)/Secretion system C-terminal sorting domain